MSTHPNTILMAVLKPDDTSRKTARALSAEYGPGSTLDVRHEDIKPGVGPFPIEEGYIRIPGCYVSRNDDYRILVMESEFDKNFQITADEGDIVIFDFVTYGCRDWITWTNLENQAKALDAWCKSNADRHKFSYEIRVSANYW